MPCRHAALLDIRYVYATRITLCCRFMMLIFRGRVLRCRYFFSVRAIIRAYAPGAMPALLARAVVSRQALSCLLMPDAVLRYAMPPRQRADYATDAAAEARRAAAMLQR